MNLMIELRDLTKQVVQSYDYQNIPLLYSGGVDSSTVLACLLSLGVKPVLYNFQFGEYASEDNKVAKSVALHFDLDLRIVKVPRDEKSLFCDAKKVIKSLNISTKTHVQCSIPFLYMSRQIAKDGYNQCFMAMAADDLLGTDRHANVAFYSGGEQQFRQYRKQKIDDSSASDFSCMKIAKQNHVEVIDVFRDKRVINFLLQKTMRELNRPKQKQILLNAFPEFWGAGKWYRKNKSLQVVSGIRDAHDTLLESRYNLRSHKAMVGIYNDILQGKL